MQQIIGKRIENTKNIEICESSPSNSRNFQAINLKS